MASLMRALMLDPELILLEADEVMSGADALGAQARTFAETFTWERAANETAAHLYRVLATRRIPR